MVKYECNRCGYTNQHRSNFIKHLNRKYICKSLKNDISIEEIKKKYKLKNTVKKSSESHPNVIQKSSSRGVKPP